MSIERTSALILRKIPHSETSEILTVISPEFGKLALIAKGSRRPKSSFAGILIPFQLLQMDYYFKSTRTIQNLKEASVSERFSNLQNNLEHSMVATILAEIALKTTQENSEIKDKFSFLVNAFRHLNQPCEFPKNTLIRFWLRWLDLAGYRPNFSACEHCEKPLRRANFSSQTGEIHCSQCANKSSISEKTVAILREFQQIQTQKIDEQTTQSFAKESLQFLTQFSKFHIETMSNLKSLTIYKQMFA